MCTVCGKHDKKLMITDEAPRRRQQSTSQQTRHQDKLTKKIIKCQVTKQEIHGLMEVSIHEDLDYDATVCSDDKEGGDKEKQGYMKSSVTFNPSSWSVKLL